MKIYILEVPWEIIARSCNEKIQWKSTDRSYKWEIPWGVHRKVNSFLFVNPKK